MKRLGFTEAQMADFNFAVLPALGFTQDQIDEANQHICGRMTVEGAPHLKAEHLPVFDCANKCGKLGQRYIAAEGHIRMMAASQPFISGAISKTINLPSDATIEDIKNAYFLSWKLGIKANALYRDGCKMSQALSNKSDKKDSKDANTSTKLSAGESKEVIVEKIIERIVVQEVPRRRKLPDERLSLTHKFSVAGHEGYMHVGMYEDGTPGEMFVKMSKEGSTLSGVMDTLALSLSMNLQYGVPLEVLCEKLVGAKFDPAGMTMNKEIPMVKSLMDYMGRWMALKFLSKDKAKRFHNADLVDLAYESGTKSKEAFAMRLPVIDEGASSKQFGMRNPSTPLRTGSEFGMHTSKLGASVDEKTAVETEKAVADVAAAPTKIEIAKQQGFTGSMCSGCGSFKMKRNGSCEVCLDCGATSGCS